MNIKSKRRVSPDEIIWTKRQREMDLYNPSSIILQHIENVKIPSNRMFDSKIRGESISILTTDLLWKSAFESETFTVKMRYACEALWAIRIVQEDYKDLSRDEVAEMFEESDSNISVKDKESTKTKTEEVKGSLL